MVIVYNTHFFTFSIICWNYLWFCVLLAQSCPTLCNQMNCSPPRSSVHGILQTRILEWVAIFFSRGSSQPRNWTQVSWFAGRVFTHWTTREALCFSYIYSYFKGIWKACKRTHDMPWCTYVCGDTDICHIIHLYTNREGEKEMRRKWKW